MKKQKPKVEIDYTPYHVRQQAWYMSLLKFYKNIEYDDKIYTDFAGSRKSFNNQVIQLHPSKILATKPSGSLTRFTPIKTLNLK